MEFVVPAAHPAGSGVGDILPAVLPPDAVATALHPADEVPPGTGRSHAVLNGHHQVELPALALFHGAVLPGGGFFALLSAFPRQHRIVVFHAEVVGKVTQVLQGAGPLAEHFPALIAHRVHQKMGMDVAGVHMGSHQYLALRPSLFRKFFRQLMGLGAGDGFLWRKGLGVVIEPHGAFLVMGGPDSTEFLDSEVGRAAHPADQFSAGAPVLGLFVLRDITGDLAQGYGGLPLVGDVVDGSHQRDSCSASSKKRW